MTAPRRWLVFLAPLCLVAQQPNPAGQYPASLLSGLRWRDVGPMRGGRTYAVAGHASQPDTFYSGSVGGGVWKTENSGRTWFPISDDGIPIGSIGAIAVAPSDPNIVYVGTGEPDIRSQNSYGIGMFKSTERLRETHRSRVDSLPLCLADFSVFRTSIGEGRLSQGRSGKQREPGGRHRSENHRPQHSMYRRTATQYPQRNASTDGLARSA